MFHKGLVAAICSLERSKDDCAKTISNSPKARLKDVNAELRHAAITLLATLGWEKQMTLHLETQKLRNWSINSSNRLN